jgi:hypothetical protein
MSARDEAVSTRASGEWPGGKVSRASPVQACRGNRHGDRIPVLVMYAADAHHQSTQGEIPHDIGLLTALAQLCNASADTLGSSRSSTLFVLERCRPDGFLSGYLQVQWSGF